MRDKLSLRKNIIILVSLVLCGCQAKPPAQEAGPIVTVSRPIQTQAAERLELVGNTQAVNTVQLVARVAGYLDKVFFNDGEVVKKDQLLFLIQQDTYQARLKQAEGQVAMQEAFLKYAEVQLIRYKSLFAQKAAAQADVDNWQYQKDSAAANLETALANRDLARLDLSYTQVSAPFTGRIDRRLRDPGNLVGAGENTAIVQLTQIDPLYVYFTVSDADYARLLKSGKNLPAPDSKEWKIYIGLTGEEGYTHEGYIDFTATTIGATTGTLLMRGVIPNPTGDILPGAYARVSVPLEEKTVLLVPEEALGSDQLGSYLLIVNKDNTVERRNIKTGFSVGHLRTIENGLKENETVITKGLIKALPGKKVSPKTETSANQVKK